MRVEDVWIGGTGVCLPARTGIATMLAEGWCDERLAASSDMESATIAGEKDSPATLAASAAAVALDRSGLAPADLGLVVHASVSHQGHEFWPISSYVQRVAAPGSRCPAFEVRAASNGGLTALFVALTMMSAPGGGTAALISTGDVFAPPAIDRWRSDAGTVYADGGTALVLSRRPGFARLRSLSVVSDPLLEGMHRSGDPFGDAPIERGRPVSLEAGRRAYLQEAGTAATVRRITEGQQEAIGTALADAGTTLAGIDRVAVPHFGRRRLETNCLRPAGLDIGRTTWDFSRTVGHLGAGDQIAGLDHLVTTGRVGAGDRILLVGVGSGFTWAAAVVEIGA